MKTKIAALALAAVALAAATTATTNRAEAGYRWGASVGIGLAAGALIGAAAASNAYVAPAYVSGPAYRDCRYVERIDAWGYRRVIRVCDVY